MYIYTHIYIYMILYIYTSDCIESALLLGYHLEGIPCGVGRYLVLQVFSGSNLLFCVFAVTLASARPGAPRGPGAEWSDLYITAYTCIYAVDFLIYCI